MNPITRPTYGTQGGSLDYFLEVPDGKGGYLYRKWYTIYELVNKRQCKVSNIETLRNRIKRIDEPNGFKDLWDAMTQTKKEQWSKRKLLNKDKEKPISKSHKEIPPKILDATWKIGSWYYIGDKK